MPCVTLTRRFTPFFCDDPSPILCVPCRAMYACVAGNGGETGMFWLEPEITPTVNCARRAVVLFDAQGHKTDTLASPAHTLRACIESQVCFLFVCLFLFVSSSALFFLFLIRITLRCSLCRKGRVSNT